MWVIYESVVLNNAVNNPRKYGTQYQSTLHTLLTQSGREDLVMIREMNFDNPSFKPMSLNEYARKAEAGKTLAKETTKAGTAGEIGRNVILLAERLCPVGWAAKLAGSIGLALFSTVNHMLLYQAWK